MPGDKYPKGSIGNVFFDPDDGRYDYVKPDVLQVEFEEPMDEPPVTAFEQLVGTSNSRYVAARPVLLGDTQETPLVTVEPPIDSHNLHVRVLCDPISRLTIIQKIH